MPVGTPNWQTGDASNTSSSPNDGILSAAKVLLKSAGYDDAAIGRAFAALNTDEKGNPTCDELLSAEAVCEWLIISLSTLWRRNIPHVKLGGLRRYYRSDVQAYLDARYERAKKSSKS